MATTDDNGPSTANQERGNLAEMRRLMPADITDRTPSCPFTPPPGLESRRGQGAVQKLALLNGAETYIVTEFEQARAVLADPRFSSDRVRHPDATMQAEAAGAGYGGGTQPPPAPGQRKDGMFIFMDPPEHTYLRKLLTGQFTVRRMKALENRAREITIEHIDAMTAAGTSGDLVPALTLPIPSLMICELLGVDYADHDEFQRNTSTPLNVNTTEEERIAAYTAQFQFMARLVAQKRAAPTDDLLSDLVHSDPPLTDRQLIDIAMLLLGAGHETTANMLALGTLALLQNPEQLERLRADPSLIESTVEELMRFLSISNFLTRVATQDLTVGDTLIPSGSTVFVSLAVTNRDPRIWAEADDLDLTRARNSHLGFGHGIHQCLGQQLARVEMRVGFSELLTRLPELRLDVPVEEVPLRNDMVVFGVHSLPVTWS